MKGSLIALVILVLGGGLVYSLIEESYADLERLESETATSLEQASTAMVEATRRINEVRVIRPNLPEVDAERSSLQRQIDEQIANLAALRATRPTERDSRGEFIRQRQSARDSASTLASATRNLAERITVIDEFTRSGQEAQRALAQSLQRVFEAKKDLEASGKSIDPALAQKIESMRRKRESLQDLSRSLYAAASGVKRSERDPPADPMSLRAQAKAIEVESEALAKELLATLEELGTQRD